MSKFKKQFVMAITLASGLLLADAIATAAVIRLRDEATVSDSIVTLRDVADVTRATGEELEALSQVQLAPAPPAGRDLILEFSTIRSRLLAHGINLSNIEFTGRSRVKVSSSEITQTSFIKLASNSSTGLQWRKKEANRILSVAIQTHLTRTNPDVGQFDIQCDLNDSQINSIMHCNRRTLVAQNTGRSANGKQTFQIGFEDQSGNPKVIEVPTLLKSLPFVLAVQSKLPRGHIIREQDLVWKQVADTKKGFVNPELLLGKETIRPLTTDEIVTQDHIQKTQLVRHNDIVSVYVKTAAFTIQRQFKSRSSGALGDQIKLVDLTGKNPVVAKVTGFREAEIVTADSIKKQIPGRNDRPIIIPRSTQTTTRTSQPTSPTVRGISLQQKIEQIN